MMRPTPIVRADPPLRPAPVRPAPAALGGDFPPRPAGAIAQVSAPAAPSAPIAQARPSGIDSWLNDRLFGQR
jgi:hypothetical protein